MKISTIASQPINIQPTVHYEIKKQNNGTPSFASSHPMPVPDYGKSILYLSQMDRLKDETRKFPLDIQYREGLLKNAGLPVGNQYYLRAIVGPDEIQTIMKDFSKSEEFYSAGVDDANIKNHTMRANLHMHTTASDGSLTVQELLDKAAEYADNVVKAHPESKAAPFVIGITDHDTTESAKEAIKIIYKDPQKYKNVRVMLGVEMTTFNTIYAPHVGEPLNVHTLVMGIDPNEEGFRNFIDGIKQKKSEVAVNMVNSASNAYQKMTGEADFFDINEGKRLYNPLSKDILGIYNNVENYVLNKLALKHIILKDKEITDALKKQNMPTDITGVMYKMNEFYKPLTGNNKVLSPEKTLPLFVSVCTGIDKEKISDKLEIGLKSDEYKTLSAKIKGNLNHYKITKTMHHDYIPTMEGVYNGTRSQSRVIIGLAHPLDYFKDAQNIGEKYDFINNVYARFTKECKEKAKFSEVFYQSYNPVRKEFSENPLTKSFMNCLSSVYGLIKTGSADSHGMSIFKRL